MTAEEIREIRESDDPEVVAQEYVERGLATLIDVGQNSMIATCKKSTKRLSIAGETNRHGWRSIYARFELGTNGGTVLYSDDSHLIVAGGLDGDGVTAFIDWMESAQTEFDNLNTDEVTLFRDGDSGRFDGEG